MKAPNKHGLNLFALDPLAQDADPLAPLAGNALVELGICRGAWTSSEVAKLNWGEELKCAEAVKGQCVFAMLF